MEAVLERCAGLDVHQETVVACAMTGPVDRKPQSETKTFKTTTTGLLELFDWLQKNDCTHVAMESTGVYWKPVWHVLEGGFELILANARHIKNVPGRKTDVKDAEWIAQLLRCGLVTRSHVPPENIRDLRDLTRYRKKLLGNAQAEKNRIHKILQDANIKLSSYMSDVFGVTGRTLIEAIINGEVIDKEFVNRVAKTQLKKKVPELVEALNGKLRKHHRNMIELSWKHLLYIEQSIHEVEMRIERLLEPYYEEVELLKTIPGVKTEAAATIIAEMGVDMSVFPTAQHAASWAGLCPGNHESAGKKKWAYQKNKFRVEINSYAKCVGSKPNARNQVSCPILGYCKTQGTT